MSQAIFLLTRILDELPCLADTYGNSSKQTFSSMLPDFSHTFQHSSTSTSSPMTATTDLCVSCKCLQNMVCVLEQLQESGHTSTPAHTTLLEVIRTALDCIEEFLTCPRCIQRSEIALVVAITCQKLVELCEKLISSDNDDAGGLSNYESPNFGDYHVKSTAESRLLTRAIILFQLRRFDLAVQKLRSNSQLRTQGAWLHLLSATDQRARKIGEWYQSLGDSCTHVM